MLRRSISHALLSLLLLLSQQIGATHAYSHWAGLQNEVAQEQQGKRDGKNAKPGAADLNCAECLSLAQIAVAIGSPSLHFAIGSIAFGPIASAPLLSACSRTVCVFQSRAPPSSLTA